MDPKKKKILKQMGITAGTAITVGAIMNDKLNKGADQYYKDNSKAEKKELLKAMINEDRVKNNDHRAIGDEDYAKRRVNYQKAQAYNALKDEDKHLSGGKFRGAKVALHLAKDANKTIQ